MASRAAEAVTAYLTGTTPESHERILDAMSEGELDEAGLRSLAKKLGLKNDAELSHLRELVVALASVEARHTPA
jgi:hypothetical protein